jgi:hypothetical protein
MSIIELITSIILLGVLFLGFNIRREMRARKRLHARKANNSADGRMAKMARGSVNGTSKPPVRIPRHND